MKKGKSIQKSAKELKAAHDEFVEHGLTKEKAILFLFMEMAKEQSTEIGMNFSTNIGADFCITVAVKEGQIEDKKPQQKTTTLTTPSYVR